MVEFSYDPEVGACYVTVSPVSDSSGIVERRETLSENPMINLDYKKDGTLYGIEILLPPTNP